MPLEKSKDTLSATASRTKAKARIAAKTDKGRTKEEVEIEGEKLKQELQKDFAGWTRNIVNIWIIGLGVSLISLAIYRGSSGKELFSDWILALLLGTSTATIIGLPLVIIKGLFSERNSNHSSS